GPCQAAGPRAASGFLAGAGRARASVTPRARVSVALPELPRLEQIAIARNAGDRSPAEDEPFLPGRLLGAFFLHVSRLRIADRGPAGILIERGAARPFAQGERHRVNGSLRRQGTGSRAIRGIAGRALLVEPYLLRDARGPGGTTRNDQRVHGPGRVGP